MNVAEHLIYPAFRRIEFRGKRRLTQHLDVAANGSRVVGFQGGMRLRLDLSESLQRDYMRGVLDLVELRLIRRLLAARGGDFVDVGAHIGAHAIMAGLSTSGRVLGIEPNPASRTQLEANLVLNGLSAQVFAGAAGAEGGEALLRIPTKGDRSWSTLGIPSFGNASELLVPVTTVDEQVRQHGLTPTMIKVDVEGGELDVFAGMEQTLDARPALLIEVSPESAAALDERLSPRGYTGFRIAGTKLRSGATGSTGIYNAYFVPGEITPDL